MAQKSPKNKLRSWFYYLKNKRVYKTDDMKVWGKCFMKSESRIVKQETIKFPKYQKREDLFVSTAFLGIDHRLIESGKPKPLVFETMVFGETSDVVGRVSTWKQAEKLHKQTVKNAKYLGMYL